MSSSGSSFGSADFYDDDDVKEEISLADQLRGIMVEAEDTGRCLNSTGRVSPADIGRQLLDEFGLEEIESLGRGSYGLVVAAKLTDRALEACKSRLAHVVSDVTLEKLSQSSGASIAIKLIPDVQREEYVLRSFWQELEFVTRLNHPNIMTMFYGFQVQLHADNDEGQRFRVLAEPQIVAPGNDGRLFCALAMERLGLSLHAVRQQFGVGMFTKDEIVLVFKQIGSALAYLHLNCLLLHNDLHLGNIVTSFQQEEGQRVSREDVFRLPVKLIDFGWAKLQTREQYEATRLASSEALGKTTSVSEQGSAWSDEGGFLLESSAFGSMLVSMALPGDLDEYEVIAFEGESSLQGSPNLRRIIIMMVDQEICIADAVDLVHELEP